MLIPTHYTIVSGKGYSEYPLVAFDNLEFPQTVIKN